MPKNTPREIIDRINAEVTAPCRPEVRERLPSSAEAHRGTPEDFAR
jgi:hypothetical protein